MAESIGSTLTITGFIVSIPNRIAIRTYARQQTAQFIKHLRLAKCKSASRIVNTLLGAVAFQIQFILYALARFVELRR